MNENMLFLAGQYIDFLLKDGKRRSYSIASKPPPEGVTALELHVRHTPGGAFTDHVFGAMKERDILRFEGPLGTFYLREDSDKPIVMVASGTGFAPIKAMCEAAAGEGDEAPDHAVLGLPRAARPLHAGHRRRHGSIRTSGSCRCCRIRRRNAGGPGASGSCTAR